MDMREQRVNTTERPRGVGAQRLHRSASAVSSRLRAASFSKCGGRKRVASERSWAAGLALEDLVRPPAL